MKLTICFNAVADVVADVVAEYVNAEMLYNQRVWNIKKFKLNSLADDLQFTSLFMNSFNIPV